MSTSPTEGRKLRSHPRPNQRRPWSAQDLVEDFIELQSMTPAEVKRMAGEV